MINSNLLGIYSHWKEYAHISENQEALNDLFELYLTYGIVDTYSASLLKVKMFILRFSLGK